MAPSASAADAPTRVSHDCSLSPAEYWSLRDDPRFTKYLNQSGEPPVSSVVVSQTEEPPGYIERVTAVTPLI